MFVSGLTKQNVKFASPDFGWFFLVVNPIEPNELSDAVESIDVKLLSVRRMINIEWWSKQKY